ncbi:MAG: class I SAM-dependent methyltransferase [Chloroflexota bacterium]|nr:MAG: class I SAM-dependent methyltransferase [Chloroflexota bacterium]
MLSDAQDAFGHELLDHLAGKETWEIIERNDGYFVSSLGAKLYFSEYEDWPVADKLAMSYVRGKVLDIGCGAGRHSLYLQEQGFDVHGIDNSPGAIEVCKRRGLAKTTLLPLTLSSRQLGVFDTVMMMGNNFGLLGNPRRARWFLRRLKGMTTPEARIIAVTRDVRGTDVPEHLEYHARNRAAGKPAGQVRIRVRYKRYVTPWIDLLMVAKDELRQLLDGTGWELRETIEGEGGLYVAIIEKV